jgi:hypothetical protein
MNENQLKFTVFCITALSNSLNIPKHEAYRLLNESGLINDWLIDCYEELHSYGEAYLVNELKDALKIRGCLI